MTDIWRPHSVNSRLIMSWSPCTKPQVKLNYDWKKHFFFFLGHGWKNLSNVIFFFLCPGWKKMSQMWHYFSTTSFIVKLMYVWYTCNRCVKQHERICDGSGLRYACLYSYSPFLLVLGEVSKLWHSFNVIKVWIKNHIGSQHWGFSSCPFNGNK